ncbi:MAG: YggS family pyridoxal phosphate enzyme [Acidimicrobiales bacterium]
MSAVVVAERIANIRERIAHYVDPSEITITAVTKGFDASVVALVLACGLGDIGENYVQELRAKQLEAPDGLKWHFIGGIQRNKLTWLAKHVQTIESISTAGELDRLGALGFDGELFIQVRSDDNPQRHGALEVDVPALVVRARELSLKIVGLMGVAPVTGGVAGIDFFRRVRRLADRNGLAKCSMGMSGDFESAVAEGATHLRLGRALLGERRKA